MIGPSLSLFFLILLMDNLIFSGMWSSCITLGESCISPPLGGCAAFNWVTLTEHARLPNFNCTGFPTSIFSLLINAG